MSRGNIDYDQIKPSAVVGNGSKFQMFGGGTVTTGHIAVYDANGNVVDGGPAGGSGTVTSVALAAPAEFTVSGSPVTTSGTLTLAKASESANTVWAAPNVSAGPPTFRMLVAPDIPNIAESQVTNLVTDLAAKTPMTRLLNTSPPLTGGGDLSADRTLAVSTMTGDSGAGGARGVVPAPASGDAAAGKYLKADGTWAVPPGGGGSGTVTSVGLTMPAEFSVAGSPITTTGTLAVAKANQTANQVYAGPTSGSAVPAFRALVAADIPTIAESQVTNLVSDLAAKAPLASPGLTGTPTAPTPATADNTTKVATTAFVTAAIAASGGTPSSVAANLVNAGPATGAAAAPTFRSLVANDIPATLNDTTINSNITVNNRVYFAGGPTSWGMSTFTDGKMYLCSNFTNTIDVIVVLSNGNVGIGTYSAASKLSVGGTADISGIAALNGGATTTTPTAGDNSTNVATTAFVQNAMVTGAYKLNRILVSGVNFTYTPTVGTRAIYVECVGGGGGGGGAPVTSSNAAAGSGGGGGGYSTVWLTGAIKASYTVVVGGGGTASSGAAGGNGVNTTFDSPSVCTGAGGGGGLAGVAGTVGVIRSGGGGLGSGGVGDMKASGNAGQPGFVLSATVAVAGNGGSSVFGGSTYGPVVQAGGNAGGPYGAGGSGGVSINGAAVGGGAGGAGVVRIWEYF